MKIDFTKASFKDFEAVAGQDAFATATEFQHYLEFLKGNGHLNYRIESLSPVGPEMNLWLPGDTIKEAAIKGTEMVGTGSGLLQHQLQRLTAFTDSLNAGSETAKGKFAFDEQAVDTECARILTAFDEVVFSCVPEDAVKRYIRYHQSGIAQLAGKITLYCPASLSENDSGMGNARFLLLHLFGMLDHIQRFHMPYADPEIMIPKGYLAAIHPELAPDTENLVALIKSSTGNVLFKDCLLDYLDVFSVAAQPPYFRFGQLSYYRYFLQELTAFFEGQPNHDDQLLQFALIRLNFNHLGFLACFQQNLKNKASQAGSPGACLNIFSSTQRQLAYLHPLVPFCFDPSWPPVHTMIGNWLEEEMALAPTRYQSIIAPSATPSYEKMPLNFSVANLACLTRLLFEEGFYAVNNVTDVLKFTAKHFHSKKQLHISPGSLSKEYYDITQVTAANVLDLLKRMSARVSRQYFPAWAALGAAIYLFA